MTMSGLIKTATNAIFGSPSSVAAPVTNYQPQAFSTPAFSGGLQNGVYSINQSPAMNSAMSGLQGAYSGFASQLSNLLPQVSSTFGAASKAAQGAFEFAGNQLTQQNKQAVSDLQHNLAQRGISGSSFANNALNVQNSTYNQDVANLATQAATTLANTSLQELDAKNTILQEANQQNVNAAQSLINQLDLEGQVGSWLASGLNSIMANNADIQSQILAMGSQERGALVSSLMGGTNGGLSQIQGGIGKGVSSIFAAL